MKTKAAKEKVNKVMKKHKLRQILLQKKGKYAEELAKVRKIYRQGWLEETDKSATSNHAADCDCCGEIESLVNGNRIRMLEKCLRKFDEALIRVALGTYGICKTCGNQISIDRLQAVPFASQCTPCKNEQ